MSREVRRVPLDFDWPLKKVWGGYLRPDELRLPTCPDCHGRGTTAARQWLESVARLILMLGEDPAEAQRGRALHPYLAQMENRPYVFTGLDRNSLLNPRPSADAVELANGLAGREPGFFGHDAVNRWKATEAIVKAAELPETWGTCATCDGNGEVATEEQRAAHEAWTKTEPPTGDGWQLWETTSEGSPTSPVFADGEALAQWMAVNPCGFGGTPIDLATARNWVFGSGWAPSMVVVNGQVMDGITAFSAADGDVANESADGAR